MKSIRREPLVHFLALGALLFLWFNWRGGASGPGSSRIAITEGIVQNLVAGFSRTWKRPPTRSELKGLVDEYVKEEIATREAIAMGLDRDDTVIRRRLRQKLEFLVDGAEGQAKPTAAELQEWLDRHPGVVQAEPEVALRQVFVRGELGDASARRSAARLLVRLRAGGQSASIEEVGDATMLPRDLPLGPGSEIERTFGRKFAERVAALPTGRWEGPVESGYGLHLVLVTAREAAATATLASVRPLVEREVLAERQRNQMEELYKGLLAKYTVTVDLPLDDTKTAIAAGAGARP